MNTFDLIISGIVIIALVLICFMMMNQRKRQLRGVSKKIIEKAWMNVKKQDNLTLQILEADAVVHKALLLVGYQGSMGEQLKKASPRFRNIDALWKAHKLRNILAHETQKSVSASEHQQAMTTFRHALGDLGL